MYESSAQTQQRSLPPLHGPTTLRTIFPAAQFDAQITLPTPKAGALSRRTGGRRARRTLILVLLTIVGGTFLPILALIAFSDGIGPAGAVISTLFFFLAMALMLLFVLGSIGLASYFILYAFAKSYRGIEISEWASARGFAEVDGSWMDDLGLRIARSGARVTHHGAYRGSVGGIEMVVGSYEWCEGAGKRKSSDVVGLIVMRLPSSVASRFRGVAVSPAGEWAGPNSGRELRFESNVMDEHIQVRVDEQQDDVAVYELFNPTFIEMLNSRPDTRFEQRGEWLGLPISVYPTVRSGVKVTPSELDADCALALHLVTRFCEEYQ